MSSDGHEDSDESIDRSLLICKRILDSLGGDIQLLGDDMQQVFQVILNAPTDDYDLESHADDVIAKSDKSIDDGNKLKASTAKKKYLD